MGSSDAEYTLHPAQIAAYRRMTPEQKIAQSMAMYWQARALKAAWLRERFPDWSEADVQAKVREIFLLATT
jgi:hypothetical protein